MHKPVCPTHWDNTAFKFAKMGEPKLHPQGPTWGPLAEKRGAAMPRQRRSVKGKGNSGICSGDMKDLARMQVDMAGHEAEAGP